MLSEERIAKLDEIGMCWTVREHDRWAEYFAAAEDYTKTFGHLSVPSSYTTSDGVKLGKWLSFLKTKRRQYGEGQYLTHERISALDRLGMVWDGISDRWERNYQAAADYYREYGDLRVPVKSEYAQKDS